MTNYYTKILSNVKDEQLRDYLKALPIAIILLAFGWAFMVILLSIDNKLSDIRIITNEARDAETCHTWPNDPACY